MVAWPRSERPTFKFSNSCLVVGVRGRIDNEIYAYNKKHSLRSNTKGYGGKTR
jgi:hypothetical protein